MTDRNDWPLGSSLVDGPATMPVRALPAVVSALEAELDALDAVDSTALAKLRSIARELIGWVGPDPSPKEAAAIEAGVADGATEPGKPSEYVALDVQLGLAGGGVTTTPEAGEVAFYNFQLVIPTGNLAGSGVLDATGRLSNPAKGMIPFIEGRFVLPRSRLSAPVREAMGLDARARTRAAMAQEAT